MSGTLLHEAVTMTPQKTKGIWRVRIIEADVMGSSGYYPAEVLRRDGPKAFRAGTHVYFDHPPESEELERPERSVKDLAGALIEDAHYEDGRDGKGLFAKVQFFPDHKETIESMASVVGMSIRAAGTIEESESGQQVVTSIVHGLSVDIVTHAGAGGRLIEMTEKATATTTTPVVAAAASQVATLSEADKSVMTTLQTGVSALNETMGKLVAYMEESKAEKEKKEEESKLTVGQVSSKLVESGLPSASQKRLAESYKDGDDLDQMITDEKAYVADLTEGMKKKTTRSNGKPEGSQKPGNVETDNTEIEDDELKESLGVFSDLFG